MLCYMSYSVHGVCALESSSYIRSTAMHMCIDTYTKCRSVVENELKHKSRYATALHDQNQD